MRQQLWDVHLRVRILVHMIAQDAPLVVKVDVNQRAVAPAIILARLDVNIIQKTNV